MPYSVFPKDTTEWRKWVLNRDHVDHQSGALTTRPRCRRHFFFFVCSVCQAMNILTRGPILCLTNLNPGCTAWVFLLAGLPRGNGQVKCYNNIIWKTIVLALHVKKLSLTHWEYVLPNVLHSIRSLLRTATNFTPHKCMFCHDKKSFNGLSLPSWVKPGPIYVKNHNRNDKSDLLVEEAKLLEANPQYAYIRLKDGREIPVSL